jgi:hypothetical protein
MYTLVARNVGADRHMLGRDERGRDWIVMFCDSGLRPRMSDQSADEAR